MKIDEYLNTLNNEQLRSTVKSMDARIKELHSSKDINHLQDLQQKLLEQDDRIQKLEARLKCFQNESQANKNKLKTLNRLFTDAYLYQYQLSVPDSLRDKAQAIEELEEFLKEYVY